MFLRESIAANSREGKLLFRLTQNNPTNVFPPTGLVLEQVTSAPGAGPEAAFSLTAGFAL
jgi:hypothetical protein